MKVYIIYSVPDYIGIEIEYILSNERDAKEITEMINAKRESWDQLDYFEAEIEKKEDILKDITRFNQSL